MSEPRELTPGPWEVEEDGENNAYIRRRIKTIWDADASPVAWDVRNVADARLMAAAPELLEAIEQAWACIEHIKEHCPPYEKQAAIGVMKGIQLAIAKAQGGEE